MPSNEITKKEYANELRITELLNSGFIDPVVKRRLQSYLQRRIASNTFEVSYKSKRTTARVYVDRGCGLQMFGRDIRKYITDGYYLDLDMVNCFPTIMEFLAAKFDLRCPQLSEYVHHRERCMERYKFTKTDMNITMNNRGFHSSNGFLKKVNQFMFTKMYPVLQENYPEMYQACQAAGRLSGFLSYVTSYWEAQILKVIHDELLERGFEPDVLIFDGLLVKISEPERPEGSRTGRRDDDAAGSSIREANRSIDARSDARTEMRRNASSAEAPVRQVIPAIERAITEQLSINMKLAIKAMTPDPAFVESVRETITIDAFSENTAEQKWLDNQEDFIQYMNTYFLKISNEKSFLIGTRTNLSEQWLLRKEQVVKDVYKAWTFSKEVNQKQFKIKMFDAWSLDRHALTLKKTVFDPSYVGFDHSQDFNMFTGLKAKLIPEAEWDIESIDLLMKHITHLNSGHVDGANYVVNWLAHSVQDPKRKMGTALVFTGSCGTGKNVFFQNFWGERVIGRNHFAYCNNIENLTGSFNSMYVGNLFMCCDEVSFGGYHKQNQILKSMITQEWQRMESKHTDAVMIDDYCNYVFLSNQDWVLRIEQSDRRYYVQNVTTVPPAEYFERLVPACLSQHVANSFYSYLMAMDISDFQYRKIPMTEEKLAQMERSCDPILSFCEEIREGNVKRPSDCELIVDENDEPDERPLAEQQESARWLLTGKTYKLTMAALYQTYCISTSVQAVPPRVFGRLIRKHLEIENVNQNNRHGGTPIFLRL